jgi:Ni,Fe-hydrogenase maturation factor
MGVNGVIQLDVIDLKAGDQICVRIDKLNVVLVVDAVTMNSRGELAKMTISNVSSAISSSTVWKP